MNQQHHTKAAQVMPSDKQGWSTPQLIEHNDSSLNDVAGLYGTNDEGVFTASPTS